MLNRVPVTEHDSWLALDAAWGCPNDCGYCFLRGSGLTGRPLRLDFPLDGALRDRLAETLRLCPRDVPVSIGNTTDLLLNPESRDILYRAAGLVSELDPGRTIVMITKAEITDRIAKEAAEAAGGHGLIFLSQSFAKEYDRRVERGQTASPEETYRSFTRIAKTEGLTGVHFWRPFLQRWNPADQMALRVRRLKDSGCLCSVVIGLKGGRHLFPACSAELRVWAEPELSLAPLPGEERVSREGLEKLRSLATETGYPLFRYTSCAAALARGRPDINGTSLSGSTRAYCRAANCPEEQRAVCARDPLLQAGREELLGLIRRYAGELRVDIGEDVIIRGEIGEYAYNHLTHVLHRRPLAHAVRPQMVWRESRDGGGNHAAE